MQPDSLQEALTGLAALKEEHRPLVAQIARDPGMAPETREMLLLHLNEEEEERVAQAQTLATQALASGGAAAGEGGRATGLTVGSLRVEMPLHRPGAPPPSSGAVRGTVGSLRT